MKFADLRFTGSVLIVLLFVFAGAEASAHDVGYSNKPSSVSFQRASLFGKNSIADKFQFDSNSCENHSKTTDCNSCPSHCHLQAASLSEVRSWEWDQIPVGWTYFENARIPVNIAFEPALRPPIL